MMENVRYTKDIIFGEPGIGKTCLYGTIVDVPEMLPAFLIDFEGNTESIEDKVVYIPKIEVTNRRGEKETQFDVEKLLTPIEGKIVTQRIHSLEEYFELFDILEKAFHTGTNPYKTIITDSFTELDYWSMDKIVRSNNFKDRVHKDAPGWTDYRINEQTISNIVYRSKNMPCNIIATCHAYVNQEGTEVTPSVQGNKLRIKFTGLFKTTICLTQSNGKRKALFQPKGKYYAKDCSLGGKLGLEMEEPTYRKIYDRRNNG